MITIYLAKNNNGTGKMIDVGNALAKKKICMKLTLDYTDGQKVIVRIIHSIYGAKDAELFLWYLFLAKALVKFGAKRSRYDPRIFYKE
jgi:hypothetical protein